MARLLWSRWLQVAWTQRSGSGGRPRGAGISIRNRYLKVETLEARAMMSAGGLAAFVGSHLPAHAGQNISAALVASELHVSFPAALVRRSPARVARDAYEPDNTWQQAKPIGVNAGPQVHTIHVRNDVDWVTFQLTTTADVVIETRGRSGDTAMWLYGSNPAARPIEYDNNGGVGKFSVIVRSGNHALGAGTYYVKVDERGRNAVISHYTLSVTALEEGDVLLTQGKGDISAMIRAGEASELHVAYANTFSHAAIYIGNGQVAEMLASGFAITSLAKRYAQSQRVDILRDRDIGDKGAAVVDAAMQYVNTPYAFAQISVFATAALFPRHPAWVADSPAYAAYERTDSGPQRMTCSELVARAYDDASLPIDVTLWPTLSRIGDQSEDFRMDFTTPTMLSLSPDFQRLDA